MVFRNHFVYASSQWETTLQCNVSLAGCIVLHSQSDSWYWPSFCTIFWPQHHKGYVSLIFPLTKMARTLQRTISRLFSWKSRFLAGSQWCIHHLVSGKLWYLQHNCVRDTIVYHKAICTSVDWVIIGSGDFFFPCCVVQTPWPESMLFRTLRNKLQSKLIIAIPVKKKDIVLKCLQRGSSFVQANMFMA